MIIHTVLVLIYVCNKYPVTFTHIFGLIANVRNVIIITVSRHSFNEVAKYFIEYA